MISWLDKLGILKSESVSWHFFIVLKCWLTFIM